MCEHCPLLAFKEFRWRYAFGELHCEVCGRRFEVRLRMKVLAVLTTAAMLIPFGFLMRNLDWVVMLAVGIPYAVVIAYAFRLLGYAAYAAVWAELEQERRAAAISGEGDGKP